MGGVKQQWLDYRDRNRRGAPDKNVCVKHFEDREIKKFIRKNYDDGYCDYCNKELKVVELDDLIDFLMDGINKFYEDAAQFMSYESAEGGYLGSTYDAAELIQDLVQLEAEPYQLTEDIIMSIEDVAWTEPDQIYGNVQMELKYAWDNFKDEIKHQTRYFFNFASKSSSDEARNVVEILTEIRRLISKFHIVKKVPSGTRLIRCRQHAGKAGYTDVADVIAPPSKFAIYPNRFSPSGISMLYSAFDEDVAIAETVNTDPKKRYATIAEFETCSDIYVVDFTSLPKAPSIFSKTQRESYYLIAFLSQFVRDVTQPISKDGKEHIEYVPTQVVTEYFRFNVNRRRTHKISGITYPSSKVTGKRASVIFWDHDDCLENLKLIGTKVVRVP